METATILDTKAKRTFSPLASSGTTYEWSLNPSQIIILENAVENDL